MNLRTPAGLFALLAFLFFSPIILSAQCTTEGGELIEEVGLEPFDYKVPINSFESVISAFEADLGKQIGVEIGGFVFVPVRMKSLPQKGQPKPKNGTIPFISKGMRIYLAYYRTNADTGIRTIAMFRYDADAMQPCVDAPQNRPGVITLPFLDSENLPPARNTSISDNDIAAFREAAPMDLSYLSYDDYLYLKSNSFYPLPSETNDREEVTHIVIKRAMVNQMFDLITPENYSMKKYRTLSFQPYPYPKIWPNQEAVMAFKYGYYCPPYWTQDPPSGDTSQFMGFSDQGVLDMESVDLQFSTTPNPVVKILLQDSILQVLNTFVRDQIITREVIVNNFPKKSGIWDRYGSIKIALITLIAGYLAGKFIPN